MEDDSTNILNAQTYQTVLVDTTNLTETFNEHAHDVTTKSPNMLGAFPILVLAIRATCFTGA